MFCSILASLSARIQHHINGAYWNGRSTLNPPIHYPYDSEDIQRPEFVPFKVPRLGAAYDHLGFWDYPSRMGWTVHRKGGWNDAHPLQSPSVSRDAPGEVTVLEKVAFLQSWLFFGALAEACAVSSLAIERDDLSVAVFDTSHLNGLPLKLFAAARVSRRAGSRELTEELFAIIRLIQLMLTRSSDWEDEHAYDWEQCLVLFSIHILLRTLSLALLCHSNSPYLDRPDALKYYSVSDVAIDWKPEGQMSMMTLTHGMLARKGWCKVEMWHILQRIDVAAFAAALERPHALQNHDSCTDTTCLAYQVDDTDYRTLHVDNECDCSLLTLDPTALRDILAKNRIPVIHVSNDLRLDVVDADETTFIAISHVWADGLGNPTQNALPMCQIRRLQHLTAALCETFKLRKRSKGRLALWIDTLCIPVAPEFKEYRKLAIRMLARTYTEASGVLVLDRELCRFESRQASVLELSIRVGCSGWLKRLWTLQEGSLAGTGDEMTEPGGTLYIQTADGPAHWNRRTHSFDYKPSKHKHKPPRRRPSPLSVSVHEVKTDLVYGMHLLTLMEDRLPSAPDIRDPRGLETRLEKIARAVQNRATSKREDEPVCMASLLGLDLAEILRADGADERMARFYTLLRDVPKAIVFAQFGVPGFVETNLPWAPFRWAPRSLLSLERPMEISLAVAAMRFESDRPSPLLGECREDGLHIRHGGLVFDEVGVVLERESVLVERESGKRYHLSLALSDMAPERIGPIGRCALLFKTDITSDSVVIVRIESEAIDSGDTEYIVGIVGHAAIKAWEVVDFTMRAGLCEGDTLAGLATRRDQRWCFT